MKLDLGMVNMQAGNLDSSAEEIRAIQHKLLNYANSLNSAWVGKEMVYIRAAIDKRCNELSALAAEIERISSDIKASGNEIRAAEDQAEREEIARQQAAKEAKEARAREEMVREEQLRIWGN